MVQKGTEDTAPKKTNDRVSFKKFEQKGTVEQRHVYQRQIHRIETAAH